MSISNIIPSSNPDLLSNCDDDNDSETHGSISRVGESSQNSIRTTQEDNYDDDDADIECLFEGSSDDDQSKLGIKIL